MKNYFVIVLAVLSFSCNHSQIKPTVNFQNINNEVTKKQSQLIYEACNHLPNNSQVSIALIKNGITVFYGVKRVNDTLFTINNEKKVFEIGSITKIFTSTLLADFVLEKKLKLEDSISGFVEDVIINSKEKITFKQLANHTSGLPRLPSNLNLYSLDIKNPYKDYTEDDLKEYLKNDIKLANIPGKKHVYSNLGASLIGYLLSKKAQVSYEELLQTRIFSKYKMNSSTVDRTLIEDFLVKGVDKNGEDVPNWDSQILFGSGRVLSCVSDLSKFVLGQFDNKNKELAITRKTTFTVNDKKKIGLGWVILNRKSNEEIYFHNGRTGGYASSLTFNLNKKNGVIILSNYSKSIEKLCFKLLKTLNQ